MSFVDRLKAYIACVEDASRDPSVEMRPCFRVDNAWISKRLIDLLERRERDDPSPQGAIERKRIHREWTERGRGTRFAELLAGFLERGLLEGAPASDVESYIAIGMARKLGVDERLPTEARTLELDRLAEIAWVASAEAALGFEEPWSRLSEYAMETRAIRRRPERIVVTPIGKVLLDLVGRDAIAWILSVELAQSTGPADPWRLSRATAEALIARRQDVRPPCADWPDWPHSWSTLKRLAVMGVLYIQDDDEGFGYYVSDLGVDVLADVSRSTGSPFSALAATLSQDESLSAGRRAAGSEPTSAMSTAAAATARQARLVAHEIRGALTPAQFALHRFYDEVIATEAEPALQRYRSRIDVGIARVFQFVGELLNLSELAVRPPEAFSVEPALRDAIGGAAVPIPIDLRAASELSTLVGYRERFVLAVVNLLRNAAQADSRRVSIEARVNGDGQVVVVTIDDDGRGVPEELRETIFERGVTLTPGGLGEGLSLVREVVEVELGGRIACDASPLGGARFTLRFPKGERGNR